MTGWRILKVTGLNDPCGTPNKLELPTSRRDSLQWVSFWMRKIDRVRCFDFYMRQSWRHSYLFILRINRWRRLPLHCPHRWAFDRTLPVYWICCIAPVLYYSYGCAWKSSRQSDGEQEVQQGYQRSLQRGHMRSESLHKFWVTVLRSDIFMY